jgi:arginine N-succinyltransferase
MAGVCAIKGAVGLTEPFYNYRIGTLVHSSRELDVFTRMDTLYLSNDLTGSTELCSLFLHPDYRSGNNGKLLSKSRFLFIAQFPHLFTEKLIAEMRGYQEESGRSPFYEGLGRHFFKMDFDHVDALTAVGKKSFIAELMPRQPMYVDYLPQDAQDVIGKVHTPPRRRAACWSRKACTSKAMSTSSTPARCCRRACPNCAPCATACWPKSAHHRLGIACAPDAARPSLCWCRTPT